MAKRKLTFSFLPIPEELMKSKVVSFGAKFLFGIIGKANREKVRWSIRYLSKRMDCSHRETQRRVKELKDNKLIYIKGRNGRVNEYRINFELVQLIQTPDQTVTPDSSGHGRDDKGGHPNRKKSSKELPKGRKQSFPQSDYIKIHEAYKKNKGIKPQGKEWNPIDRDIKLMFESNRTPEQIIAFMEWLNWARQQAKQAQSQGIRTEYEWTINWTIKTVRMKIPEFVADKFKEKSGKEALEEMYPNKLPKT